MFRRLSVAVVAVFIPILAAASEPRPRPSDVRITSNLLAVRSPDWIDLGEERSVLYLSADYVPTTPSTAVELVLTTGRGAERLRLDVESSGSVHLWLYPRSVSGPAIDPTKKYRVLVRIVSHKDKADELFVRFSTADTLPTESETDADWTLINRTGSAMQISVAA